MLSPRLFSLLLAASALAAFCAPTMVNAVPCSFSGTPFNGNNVDVTNLAGSNSWDGNGVDKACGANVAGANNYPVPDPGSCWVGCNRGYTRASAPTANGDILEYTCTAGTFSPDPAVNAGDCTNKVCDMSPELTGVSIVGGAPAMFAPVVGETCQAVFLGGVLQASSQDSCVTSIASGYANFAALATRTATLKCTDANTYTPQVTIAAACTAVPTAVGGSATEYDFTNVGAGSCSAVAPNAATLAVGTGTCIAGTKTSARYFNFGSGAADMTKVQLKCSASNTYVVDTAIVQDVALGCFGSSTNFGTDVDASACIGTNKFKNGATCTAVCATGKVLSAGDLSFTCNAAANTFAPTTVQAVCTAPTTCTVPPTASDIYDFTAGTTPCASITSLANGATCDLKCKGNTFPKANVAPTFTCDAATNTLKPTTFDICVPGSNLPAQMYVYGKIVPAAV